MKQASAFGSTPGWNIARHQQPTAAKCTNQQLAGTPLAREVPRPTSHEDLHEESYSRVPAGGAAGCAQRQKLLRHNTLATSATSTRPVAFSASMFSAPDWMTAYVSCSQKPGLKSANLMNTTFWH